MVAVAKSYMRKGKGFLIYEELLKYLTKYEDLRRLLAYMTLQPLHSEFAYTYMRKI